MKKYVKTVFGLFCTTKPVSEFLVASRQDSRLERAEAASFAEQAIYKSSPTPYCETANIGLRLFLRDIGSRRV